MRVLQCVLVVAALVFMPSSATAAYSVLFEDNFDSGTVGGLPGPAAVGTWVVGGGAVDAMKVVDAGTPGPVSSPNYLSIVRSSWNQMNAAFPRQTNPGDLIRFEADFYGVAGAKPYIDIWDGANELNWVMTLGDGSISAPGSGTTLTYNPGEWNHLIMDYHPAASTFDLSINGNVQTGVPMYQATTGVDAIGFSSVLATSYYDNVKITLNPSEIPEPSSFVLLISAALGLVVFVRRRLR